MNTFTKIAEDWIKEHQTLTTAHPTSAPPAVNSFGWAEDFHRWALDHCVYRDRCFGGIGALHRDFCEWLIAHDEVPCTRQAFESLMDESGFFSVDGMVSGLILREDS
jgi:hypothetical protein